MTARPQLPDPNAGGAALTKEEIATLLHAGVRTLERMIARGDFPEADLRVGGGAHKSPRWWPATVRRWIDDQDRRKGA